MLNCFLFLSLILSLSLFAILKYENLSELQCHPRFHPRRHSLYFQKPGHHAFCQNIHLSKKCLLCILSEVDVTVTCTMLQCHTDGTAVANVWMICAKIWCQVVLKYNNIAGHYSLNFKYGSSYHMIWHDLTKAKVEFYKEKVDEIEDKRYHRRSQTIVVCTEHFCYSIAIFLICSQNATKGKTSIHSEENRWCCGSKSGSHKTAV